MEKNNKDVKEKNINNLEKKQDKQPKKDKEIKNCKWNDLNYFNKLNVKNYIATFLLIIIFYFVLSFTFDPNDAFSYTRGIYISILIYVLFSVSLNITVGLMGQLNLGQAGFIAIGGYSAAFISKILVHYNLPPFLQLILVSLFGGLVAAVFGFLVGGSTLRLRGDYLAIITLAFGEIIRVLIEYFKFTGGAQGLTGIPRVNNFTLIYFITIFSVIFMYAIMTSRHGRAILAIREDEIASGASGINTTYYKTFAFVLSAIFAGIAGGIYAHNLGILGAKQFDYNYSINILVMVVLGGMGSFTGSILSAIVLTILPEVLRSFAEYRMIVYPLILIIMMLFRPKGLLGREEFQISKVISYFTKKRGETNGK